MYLQITTRCNMKCKHCCWSCKDKGDDMSMDVFDAAIGLGEESLALGGGEPTLHPNFETMLLSAIGAGDTFVVHNGTHIKRSRMLFPLYKAKVISGGMSYDQYHDMSMVDDDIFNDYRRYALLWGKNPRANSSIVASGRGRHIAGAKVRCPCEDIFVKPNGDIHQCGCIKSPKIGDVYNGWDSEVPGTCYLELT